MTERESSGLPNAFTFSPQACTPVETPFRRITTALPAPETAPVLADAVRYFPQVNCYQPPIVWDRAEKYQVFDAAGNCWIDFSSTAVACNSGHGHPAIRAALAAHVEEGLLAQFSFASEIRVRLARRLVELAPPGMDKAYLWTVGSEAIEAALRVAREWGQKRDPRKYHLLAFGGDFHGWTLGAHQLSGTSAAKPWLQHPDTAIHHIPFPTDDRDGPTQLDESIAALAERDVHSDQIAAVFIETLQGWGALPFPVDYMQALRRWADAHEILLIFDEIQTGFGRTGKLFAHEHYDVRADLLCVGKGISSSLPLAAVLGPAAILDTLNPADITTTHAGHPLSCVAALANLDVIFDEGLIEKADRTGQIAREELRKLQQRFPKHIAQVSGLGLLNAIHLRDPATGKPDKALARDLVWEAVKRGVMLFHTNRETVKVCPPLVIPPEAVVDGIAGIGEALETLV